MDIPNKSRSYTSFNAEDLMRRIDALIGCVMELDARCNLLESKLAECGSCEKKAPAKKSS